MIAPKVVKFYNKDWEYLGSKSDDHMQDRLNRITGVDKRALRGGHLCLFSAARKMSWASKRNTKLDEDIAYCLLGIFDISMPMLYGEGNKAFIRLQEEIVKQYDDESLFAWKTN